MYISILSAEALLKCSYHEIVIAFRMFPEKLKCSFNFKSIIGVLVFSNLSELYQNHFSANTKDTSGEENKFFIFLSFKITLVFLFFKEYNCDNEVWYYCISKVRSVESIRTQTLMLTLRLLASSRAWVSSTRPILKSWIMEDWEDHTTPRSAGTNPPRGIDGEDMNWTV